MLIMTLGLHILLISCWLTDCIQQPVIEAFYLGWNRSHSVLVHWITFVENTETFANRWNVLLIFLSFLLKTKVSVRSKTTTTIMQSFNTSRIRSLIFIFIAISFGCFKTKYFWGIRMHLLSIKNFFNFFFQSQKMTMLINYFKLNISLFKAVKWFPIYYQPPPSPNWKWSTKCLYTSIRSDNVHSV